MLSHNESSAHFGSGADRNQTGMRRLALTSAPPLPNHSSRTEDRIIRQVVELTVIVWIPDAPGGFGGKSWANLRIGGRRVPVCICPR